MNIHNSDFAKIERTPAEQIALMCILAGDGYYMYKLDTELSGMTPLDKHVFERLTNELDTHLNSLKNIALVNTVPNPVPTC